jgi:hypothetical protein
MAIKLLFSTITIILLTGCGGGGGDDDNNKKSGTSNQSYTKDINLWDYVVPNSSKEDSFSLTTNSKTSKYKTRYSVSSNKVEEVSTYSKNEKTIYKKNNNTIIISFEKDGKPNGTYNLINNVNIGDKVTEKKSDCKLTNKFDKKSIQGKEFSDLIEITCSTHIGYYQRGIGEVAQFEKNSAKNIRMLSN